MLEEVKRMQELGLDVDDYKLPEIPKEAEAIGEMSIEMHNQIIVLRVLLGKTLVIGDEVFLSEYGCVGEENQKEST